MSTQPTESASRRVGGQMPAWEVAELPAPPPVTFRNVLRMIGPGTILLATCIGGGEWLVGPAAVVKYGPAILGVVTMAIFFQVIFNLEAIRYTLYTGEPIYGGFLRLKPGPRFWTPFYCIVSLAQLGWPALAAAAASTLIASRFGRLPTEADSHLMLWLGALLLLLAVLILSIGGTIERMLERVSAVMLVFVLTFLLVVNIFFVPLETWGETLLGFFQLSAFQGDVDWVLLGALAATAASGGIGNLTITNWVRDKGFGMGARTGAIPAAFGGRQIEVSHFGKVFAVNPASLRRWKTWIRYVHFDQVWVWGAGAFVGMFLNVNLAAGVIPRGTEMSGMGVGIYQALYMAETLWFGFWALTLFNGFWILFSTQLGNTDTFVRTVTDLVWMGSGRLRNWRGGKIQTIYYVILILYSGIAFFAMQVATPLVLFQILANVAGFVMILGGLQIFLVNRKLLPQPLRPSRWREAALLGCVVFYSVFVGRVLLSVIPKLYGWLWN